MKSTISLIVICFILIENCAAPPVVKTADNDKRKAEESSDDVLDTLEYGRYLKEVIDILESDAEFKKKIQNATVEDIKSGNIAEHLSLVQHNVRSKLDEAKRREMTRLRELIGEKIQKLSQKERRELAKADSRGRKIKEFLPQHVDHRNSETFGEVDLERLIRRASKDLDEIDQKREQEFKEYEIQKEYNRRAKLAKLKAEERNRLEKLHQEILEKKKQHPKVNHPGSVDQMEEVWEKVDHLEPDTFTPKSFFQLHDINSDGLLDETELEAIMLQEVNKIYQGMPEPDPVEREAELERMRQHVMKEFDKNDDRMVSFDEFIKGINAKDAKNEQGWQSIEDSTIFSNQEFEKFSKQVEPISTSIPPHQTPTTTKKEEKAQVQAEPVAEPQIPAVPAAQVPSQ